MKEFYFDEYHHCINPNRIAYGNKEFYGEVHTAFHKDKWYVGDMYWCRGTDWENPPSLNTNNFDTEREAIIYGIEHIIDHLTWIQEKPFDKEVPGFIFKELKKLLDNYKNPQLELFSHS